MTAHVSIEATTARTRTEAVLLAAILIFLTGLSFAAVAMQIERPLEYDEAEYLHAAWMMGEGRRIYRDFMEDHPPFLYQVLLAVKPASEGTPSRPDVLAWTVRGRIFTAICGTISVLAAGLAVWRTSRSAGAVAITVAALFGAHMTWMRGIAEIRADAPTLALFLCGLVLLLWDEVPSPRMAWLLGSGIALAIAAEIWNPKWPLEGLCLGGFFVIQFVRLVRARWSYAIGAIVPTVIVVAIAYLALTSVASVRDYLCFNFILKSQNLGGLESHAWMAGIFARLSPTHFAPKRFTGLAGLVGYGLALGSLAWQWRRLSAAEAKRWVLMLVLVIAAVLEVRFVYPWPNLWSQFFLMLAYTLSMAYGLAGAGLARFVASFAGRPRNTELGFALILLPAMGALAVCARLIAGFELQPPAMAFVALAMLLAFVPVALALTAVRREGALDLSWAARHALFPITIVLAVPALAAKLEVQPGHSAWWAARSAMRDRMAPGETVWAAPSRHPIVAPDASYFWYSFPDLVSMTLARIASNPALGAYLPKTSARDIPLCQLARGEAPLLRFIEISPYVSYIPGACDCALTVLARPDVAPSPAPAVYEVLRPGTRPMPVMGQWNEPAVRRFIMDTCSRRSP